MSTALAAGLPHAVAAQNHQLRGAEKKRAEVLFIGASEAHTRTKKQGEALAISRETPLFCPPLIAQVIANGVCERACEGPGCLLSMDLMSKWTEFQHQWPQGTTGGD